jgi:hypothetical protein
LNKLENVMVWPAIALLRQLRSVLAPLSAVLDTTQFAGGAAAVVLLDAPPCAYVLFPAWL